MRARAHAARPALLAAACAAAAFLVFAPSLSHGLINWDDGLMLADNAVLRGPWPALLRWAFVSAPTGAYQPLAYLVWAALGRTFGFAPRVFHAASALLHALAAALAFFAARRLLKLAAEGREPGAAADVGALFAALVFAVHPLRVESVSWAAELRDPLSGALWLGALLAYLRARAPGRARRSLAPACALFTAACLAKGTAVTFPLVLLIVDLWPLRRSPLAAAREKIPMLALTGALGAVAVAAQRGARASASWADHGAAARAAQTAYALAFYARKTLWPSGLSPIYELHPPLNPLEPRFLLSIAAVALFAVGAWRARRARPAWAAAGAASAIILLPLSGILQSGSQLVADRYSYLGALPWALLAGAALRAAWLSPGPRRGGAALAAAAAVAGLSAACVAQQSYWRDSESLWSRVLAVEPDSGTAALQLGDVRADQRRYAEAEALFARAEATDPACAADFAALGALAAAGRGDGPEARGLRAALDPRPICRKARSNRAAAQAAQGNFAAAREGFVEALAADPDDAAARLNLRRLDGAAAPRTAAQPR